jgi:hypothetical protein
VKVLRVAFDVGGVLSKYPEEFRRLIDAFNDSDGVEVLVISDMHPEQKIREMLAANGFFGLPCFSADYYSHGEACKAVLCERLGVDILVDDFIGYVATPGQPRVRLLVMPDPSLPYYADSWKTDGSEGDFGRRRAGGGV